MFTYRESKEFLKDLSGLLKKIPLVNQICLNLSHTQELESIRKENEYLKNQMNSSKSLYYDRHFFWKIGKDGMRIGPYCPRCWDTEQKEIELIVNPGNEFDDPGYLCPVKECPLSKVGAAHGPISTPQIREQ